MQFEPYRTHSVELDGKMVINGENLRIWKEVVTAYFKVLSRNFPGH
jgi:hypothetical protein